MRIPPLSIALAGAFALSACGPSEPDQNAGVIGNDQVTRNDLMSNETAAAEGPLAAYVGKYPFDDVDGVRFLDQPLVREGLARAAGATAPAELILSGPGPVTPIAMEGDRILSWGCEQHNCGPHNWALLIAPDGSNPELCYHDEDARVPTIWLVDGRVTDRTGECPSGDGTA